MNELKELTIEELLAEYRVSFFGVTNPYNEAKREILSRFAKLEKEIVRLEKSVNYKLVDNH